MSACALYGTACGKHACALVLCGTAESSMHTCSHAYYSVPHTDARMRATCVLIDTDAGVYMHPCGLYTVSHADACMCAAHAYSTVSPAKTCLQISRTSLRYEQACCGVRAQQKSFVHPYERSVRLRPRYRDTFMCDDYVFSKHPSRALQNINRRIVHRIPALANDGPGKRKKSLTWAKDS